MSIPPWARWSRSRRQLGPGSRFYPYSLLILETVLMTAFGVSWFIKGGKLFAGR